MKKQITSMLLAICLTVGLIPALIQEAAAASVEQAWFPAPQMSITQIAYEGYSHTDRNAIDFTLASGQRVFAPFTGTIVFTETNYNFILLQSNDMVCYADGTVDYMTVGFMHDSNISDLKKGQVIKQGEPFYDAGQKNKGEIDSSMGVHVQISVFRGKKNGISGSYSKGDVYAFNAFCVNPNKTSTINLNTGKLREKNGISNPNAPKDWSGLWKDLNGNTWPISTGTSTTTTANTAKPTISGSNAPGALQVSQTFSIKGTVSSSTKLTSVTAGVYTSESGGTMKTGKSANPNSTSYSLTKLDPYVLFNKLSAGTYWYRVTATNFSGTTTLVNTKFTVQPAKAPTISGQNAPGTLKVGKTFSIKGTISSGTKLTSVTAGVYTAQSGGTMKTGKSASPNSTSYSLTKLDPYVLFNKLPAGTYWYRVTATNSSGTTTLVNQKFTVAG